MRVRTAWTLIALIALPGCKREPVGGLEHLPGGSDGGSGGTLPPICDADLDGYLRPSCGGGDCDDWDASRNPGAQEICDDGIDQNCDGPDPICHCEPGDARRCWPFGLEDPRRDTGVCIDGAQYCEADGDGFGPCQGAVLPGPVPERCDQIDANCDGSADRELMSACGTCGDPGPEICGNGLDDDCDGTIDPPSLCNVSCLARDPLDPNYACCTLDGGKPQRFSVLCTEVTGLPACPSDLRHCLDLDPFDGSTCVKTCTLGRCVCTRPSGDVDGCGFETACARLRCEEGERQACYGGPPQTLGVGRCRAGIAVCVQRHDGSRALGSCEGEVRPQLEVCGNGLDDDCDGWLDEEDGVTGMRCPYPPECSQRGEVCGDGLDNDCDGFVDEACVADRASQKCWPGPGTPGEGPCVLGTQKRIGTIWGPCVGAVVGTPERCGDGIDSDCDGYGGPGEHEEVGCCVPREEVCNGEDDDCDGIADDGVTSACGKCFGDPCFTIDVDELAACNNPGACESVEPDLFDRSAFTIGTDLHGATPRFLFVPLTGAGDVAWTRTSLPDVKRASAHGTSPHLVQPAWDGSVWVASDGPPAILAHLDERGELLCSVPLPAAATGIGLDPWSDVWLVTGEGVLLKASARGIVKEACALFDLARGDPDTVGLDIGLPNHGLSMTADGVLWTASSPSLRYDTRTGDYQFVSHDPASSVATDRAGGVWFAGPVVHRVEAEGPYFDRGAYETTLGERGERVFADDDDFGAIWWMHDGNAVHRSFGGELRSFELPGPSSWLAPFGGELWALGTTGSAHSLYWPGSSTWTTVDIAPGVAVDAGGDPLGAAVERHFRTARWTAVVDGGSQPFVWEKLDWQQLRPEATSVEVRVRFAARRAELETSPTVCGPFDKPPVRLDGCAGNDGRWIEIAVRLVQGEPGGRKPSLGNFTVGGSPR